MGSINFELSEQQYLLVYARMSSLSFVRRTFDWGGGSGFGWRESEVAKHAQRKPLMIRNGRPAINFCRSSVLFSLLMLCQT